MSGISILWIVWACLTAGTLALLLYRATLTLHEDDQLFLSDVAQNGHERQIQEALIQRVQRLAPYVRTMTGATGLATAALVGIYTVNAIHVLAK